MAQKKMTVYLLKDKYFYIDREQNMGITHDQTCVHCPYRTMFRNYDKYIYHYDCDIFNDNSKNLRPYKYWDLFKIVPILNRDNNIVLDAYNLNLGKLERNVPVIFTSTTIFVHGMQNCDARENCLRGHKMSS